MKQYLKSYRVIMHTVGPVFVGSGKEIGKKEYLFLNRKQVGITDIQLLYAELKRQGKENAFEEYLLGKGNFSLTQWMEKQRINPADWNKFIKYRLDCGDAILDKGANRLQILGCIKDAYGMSYIPGSSLKGMFRTILLGADIIKEPGKYAKQKDNMRRNAGQDEKRMRYLKRDIGEIEGVAFRTLNRPDSKPQDAVNDILQGFVISDSEPLSVNDLVLCQKIDRHTNGEEKQLPILRECIKPHTEIRFTMTVDTSLCKLSEQQIMEAVKIFATKYHENFACAFKGMDAPKENYVFCGGGCGFVSKTVVYPMYGKQEGLEFAQLVFEKTKVPQAHKHHRDRMYGASPHTIKCTRYQGKLLQMGMCSIESIEAV
ncbi:MAG: type III-A CRISPR-associated RAMP protein Csm5 [Bacteroidales bacterium]|nr:type III-A CRISPR-associated RAMP protein Csm5 [Lachnoclostridium sp.]MCM1383152.1 type III-A CRISPR-associated RAMP protein Csm5 [Lachnoclostridium sp.]MCM1464622.1 type III-A CRISPR-associated RAMP protein Csm5 [Bacteroidales bacterium]